MLLLSLLLSKLSSVCILFYSGSILNKFPLSRYAHGETTGVVLDSGDGVTHCVPIFEGFSIQHAATRIDLGGRDITENLALLLRKTGHNFHTSVLRTWVIFNSNISQGWIWNCKEN